MTTQIYSEDISVYNGYKLVGGIAANLYYENTGTEILEATLILSLVQHEGLGNESNTVLQCWVKKNINPNDIVDFTGVYFLREENLELVLSELNKDSQTLRLIVNVTGGGVESDRTALVKQSYTDVIDYSTYDAKY